MKKTTMYPVLAAIVLALLCSQSGWGAGIWFTSSDLRVPAQDLAAFLSAKTGTTLSATLAGPDQKFAEGDWVLASAVKNKIQAVESALPPAERAYLETNGQESFAAINAGNVRYLVGGGHRGVTYASVWIQRLWIQSATPPLSVAGEPIKRTPFFKERIGGASGLNASEDYSQPKPTDYDWETYARDLAHCGVSLTPGVVQGQTVPDEVLRDWGIRKILSYPSNPFSTADLRKWRQSSTSDVRPSEDPRSTTTDTTSWMPCPSTDFGRATYRQWLNQVLSSHKTAVKLVFYFTDGGMIPGTECSPGSSRAQRVLGFLQEMRTLVKGIAQDVDVLAHTRGLSAEEVREVAAGLPAGSGLIFDEPCRMLLDSPATGFDASLPCNEWDPGFTEVIQETLRARPNDCFVLVAAGDTDAMVSPAVGMAAPRTAHSKLQRLAEMRCVNIGLALGGFHPWVYSPNVEVFKEMIWDPTLRVEDLTARIAQRDFDKAAQAAQEAWSLFDQALARYPNISRSQSLEAFVRKTKDLVTRVPNPANLRDTEWFRSMQESAPYTLEGLPSVIRLWEEGAGRLQHAQDETEGASYQTAKNLRDGVFWSSYYARMLRSQYHLLRCLNLLKWMPETASANDPPWQEAFLPLYRDELENCARWKELLFTSPEPNLRLEKEPMNPSGLGRKLEQKEQSLRNLTGS